MPHGQVHGRQHLAGPSDPATCWTMAITGDGYQVHELSIFKADCDAFVASLLLAPPFDVVGNLVGIHRIDVSSTDSGADDPATHTTARTYFEATYGAGHGQLHRLLALPDPSVALDLPVSMGLDCDTVVVLVNAAAYGGSGGDVSVMSRDPQSHRIGLHELGHTAFGLSDEYAYLTGCGLHERHSPYPAPAPANRNITTDTVLQDIPWKAHVKPGVQLPTTKNPNRDDDCDPGLYLNLRTTVGLFEGAGTFHSGAYRPQFDCLMRELGMQFCEVCQAKITARIRRLAWP
jgi:hypothetical protein